MSEVQTTEMFEWNPTAVLVKNDRTIVTPDAADKIIETNSTAINADKEANLVTIANSDNELALFQAFAAVRASKAFCISDTTVPQSSIPEPRGKFITQTSGTTSTPRSILRSQISWINSFNALPNGAAVSQIDKVAVCGQLVHSLSLYAAIEAIHVGATLHIINEIAPRSLLREIIEREITVIYATPTQLRLIAYGRDGANSPLSSVTRVFIGGSKLDVNTRGETQELFPAAQIIEFYGASETSFISITDRDTPAGSVGKSFPNVDIDIRNPDGTPTASGEIGEIWVNSPYLFDRYVSDNGSTTRFDGSFLTIGEKGKVDIEGNLFVEGRAERMAIIADQNVFLEPIEDDLRGIENVVDAAVIPRSDAARGQVLVAAIICENTSANLDEILQKSKELLGPLKSPRQITILSEWPVLQSGKTDYRGIEKILNGSSE